jgi:glucosylceramidase
MSTLPLRSLVASCSDGLHSSVSSMLLLLPAFAFAGLLLGGCGGSATPTTTVQPTAVAPTFSPIGGSFTATQSVTITDATTGASIYYTTDGSTPTIASTKYSSPISVAATTTIKAIAIASGFNTSAVASGTFTINLPAAATPTFSPAGGTFTVAQSITITDATPGATIHYTVDGSTPTAGSANYSAPVAVATTTTIQAIATASGFSPSTVGSAVYTINIPTQQVSVVLSTHDQTQLLAPQAAVTFGTSAVSSNQLLIDENQQYQSIEGFGAAFTDSAAYLLEQVAQPSQLPGTLSDLFTRTGNGIGLSFMRNPMGASDLARSLYTFDDLPVGSSDPNLTSFSIAHDQSYVLPLILAAKKLNPQMKLMANPWSPPAWMKSTGTLEGGGLAAAHYTVFANYFVKYLQAYQAAGILPDYISVQNEPLYQTSGYPSMYMDAPTQTIVMRDYVLPALTAANLPTKIFVYDHNWDKPTYPATVLSDPILLASPQIAGTAWHGYGGTPGAQQGVQNSFPTKGTWETEHSGGTFVSDQFTSDFTEITLVLRNAGKSYVKWSLALDEKLGPNLPEIPNGGYGGCSTCTPIVTINSSTGAITKDIEFYTLGQYSKFILPGAVRVWSSDTPTIVSSAFVNPDGTRVLVAFNNSLASQAFQVQWGTQNFSYTLPGFAAATFTWTGTQTGIPAQSATQQIQGVSYSSQSGLEVEEASDVTGSYDLGYVTDGAYALYKNVDFGASVSKVNVRTASGGNGGTLEFHLDSATGSLLGTATLPVTGGYQTWVTVNAPITGASGVHTLYLVFHGSGGIANVNWFQFQ